MGEMTTDVVLRVLRKVLPCPDCDGIGALGIGGDGRVVSCKTCGGHEDALGTGISANLDDPDTKRLAEYIDYLNGQVEERDGRIKQLERDLRVSESMKDPDWFESVASMIVSGRNREA